MDLLYFFPNETTKIEVIMCSNFLIMFFVIMYDEWLDIHISTMTLYHIKFHK